MLNRVFFGTLAVSVLSAQSFAADAKKSAVKWQCEKSSGKDNSCSTPDASCSGKAESKEVLKAKDEKDCKSQGGEWKKVSPEHKK